jgi:hypothetical protein
VAQSRLGFFVEKDLLKGQLEFDFIDFTRAAPNQNANPRLRIANIDYHIDSRQTLSLGQTWDIFSSPQKPFTYNIVGLYFEAGNVGFMRPQFRYSYQTDTQWTFGFAIGLPARNLNATDGEVEKSLLPTLSATAIHHATQGLQWGGSMIAAEIRAAAFPTPLSQVYGVNTFVSTESESGFKTRSSIYVGRNLASIGALSLAWATGGNHDEVGGYCTFSNPLSETLSVQGGLGGATILQAEGSTLDSIAGVRVNSNLKTELAFAYHPQTDADIYIQTTFMNTHYTKTNGDADSKVAMALQIGSVYRF